MVNQISGRVIAVNKEVSVTPSDASKQPIRKREIYIDCTRYDQFTGERSQYENKPLLEFAGDRVLEKVNPVLDTIQKDDIVTISFELQGRSYKDREGKTKYITGIRCYDIEVRRKADGQQVQQQPAPQPQQASQAPLPPPAPEAKDPDLPF